MESDACAEGDRGQRAVRWDRDVVEDVSAEGGDKVGVVVEAVEAGNELQEIGEEGVICGVPVGVASAMSDAVEMRVECAGLGTAGWGKQMRIKTRLKDGVCGPVDEG